MKSFRIAEFLLGNLAAQHIAKSHGFQIVGISPADLKSLLAGPLDKNYINASSELLSTGVFLNVEGEDELYHIDSVEGDWWAIHPGELTRFYEGLIHESEEE